MLSELNKQQQRAVNSNSNRILCLAGAGTGKTKTLVSRVKKLIDDGVPSNEILCLTFTRMAGLEMKERLGDKGKDIFINTFHSFCSMVISENLDFFSLKDGYSIYDQNQREKILKSITKKLRMEKEKIKMDVILDCIFENKNYMDTPHRRGKLIANEYKYFLKSNNAIDIDLLIYSVVNAFKENKEMIEKYHKRYKYIFIDEFQDTNDSQMSFVKSINPENLFLVGDDYQSIYAFNGAKVEYILDISKNPSYEVIRLEENYRSTEQIIKAANNLISYNKTRTEKNLIAHKKGEDITFDECLDFGEEIQTLINKIDLENPSENPSDYAVLTRTNKQLELVKEAFIEKGIPYRVLGQKIPCLEDIETKNLMKLIQVIKDPLNEGVFNDYLEEILEEDIFEEVQIRALEEETTLYEVLLEDDMDNLVIKDFLEFIDECQMEDLIQLPAVDCLYNLMEKNFLQQLNQSNLSQLISFASKWSKVQLKTYESNSILNFVRWFQFKEPSDIELILRDSDGIGVNLSTVHSSKGLEFSNVFLIGMNEGIFPHKKGDIEEERRLCYVAITRAKEKLYVSWSKEKKEEWSGKEIALNPSLFIKELQK